MGRKKKIDTEDEIVKRTPKAAKTATKKKTTEKKSTTKKKAATKKTEETEPKKKAPKKASTEKKSTTKKKAATKKTEKTTKKSTTKKKAPAKKKTKKDIHPVVNIGTAGHVDEGKSTLVQALTGVFPDVHSEEIKKGITIRLGYADTDIMKCPECSEPEMWTVEKKCPICGAATEHERRVSFVDAPGHEILMQVMLSGAAIMDGVILVIGANNPVPQPQTREHLAAITALGITNVIIVQNKVELITKEEALENYNQIKNFLKGTIAEDAPIIPMSAIHGINLDILLSAIEEFIPTPKYKEKGDLRLFAARSFDINRPGTSNLKLKGGVFGGSIRSGKVSVGDTIKILPGLKKKVGKQIQRIPVETEVVSIRLGTSGVSDVATPGGLVAIQTLIDPSMTRSDNLSGCIITKVGDNEPLVSEVLDVEFELFEKVVGSDETEEVKPLTMNETLLLTIGTYAMIGVISSLSKNKITLKLRGAVAYDTNMKIAISRNINKRWRLIGYGKII